MISFGFIRKKEAPETKEVDTYPGSYIFVGEKHVDKIRGDQGKKEGEQWNTRTCRAMVHSAPD